MSDKKIVLRLRNGKKGPGKYVAGAHTFLKFGPGGKPSEHEVDVDLATTLLSKGFFEKVAVAKKPEPVKPVVDDTSDDDMQNVAGGLTPSAVKAMSKAELEETAASLGLDHLVGKGLKNKDLAGAILEHLAKDAE